MAEIYGTHEKPFPATNSEVTPDNHQWNGWKMYFHLGWRIFRDYVSCREGKYVGKYSLHGDKYDGTRGIIKVTYTVEPQKRAKKRTYFP